MNEPMLAVCVPYDEKEPSPGNGNMVALSPALVPGTANLGTMTIEPGGAWAYVMRDDTVQQAYVGEPL